MASSEKMKTKKVKVWYQNLLVPRTNDSGAESYDCMLLIPKSDTDVIARIKELSEGLAKTCFGKAAAKAKMPLKDGADFTNGKGEHPDEMDDYMYVNAKSQYKPQVSDIYFNTLDSEADVYSGMICIACINFYSYDQKTNKGISCGLSSLVKVGAGQRIAGQSNAEDDFAGVDLSQYAEDNADEEDY